MAFSFIIEFKSPNPKNLLIGNILDYFEIPV